MKYCFSNIKLLNQTDKLWISISQIMCGTFFVGEFEGACLNSKPAGCWDSFFFSSGISPFAPELPVTTHADLRPFYDFYCSCRHPFCRLRTTLSPNLCSWVKRSFKPYQNEHNSVKEAREKGKKCAMSTQQFPRKSCSPTHLHVP